MQTAVTNLELNKPVYVGFSVLDLSKLLMYEFHYEKMREQYGNDIKLCFTDTDSFLYEIRTDDVYADMLRHADEYDFSAYPPNHPNFDPRNKKVIGKFKDELNGLPLEEFIGVLPKCYSLQYREHDKVKEKQAAKGSTHEAKKRFLRHEHYCSTLQTMGSVVLRQNMIKSRNHELGTYNQSKVALTAFDIKRWICGNNVDTLAHGHYKTM